MLSRSLLLHARPLRIAWEFLGEFKQFRSSLVLYGRLGPYIRAESRLLVLTVLTMLTATILTLARPWPMQVIIDSVLGGRPVPSWITGPVGDLTK
jgi:hypothetical protein